MLKMLHSSTPSEKRRTNEEGLVRKTTERYANTRALCTHSILTA